VVCLDDLDAWLGDGSDFADEPPDDTVMIVGTGGTTGRPKGVQLTDRNIETMTALTLMGYPFAHRPVYLAMAPLTHAAGVLCFPVMAMGGEVVIMAKPDLTAFLALVERHRVTHTFLPPTLIYMLLAHERLAATDLSSLQCFWYGAAPMSPSRLEQALTAIGPVMAQLFGQSEAPMMISMLPPAEHFRPDGSIATERLASAGRPAPLVTLGILASDGTLLPSGERGEIAVRSSLVMAGYYKNPEATAEASQHGWHHTGDIGYVDEDGYLFIVDRAKDMIITGGFNVYSAEVEQALLAHPAVRDCGVVGLPDEKWGERVVAVVQPQEGADVTEAELIALRQGADRQRQGAQAGARVAGPAALDRGEGAEGGDPRAVCAQLRTSRAIASDASRTFSSASGPPAAAACRTQVDRCSSRSSRENACSALVAADTCVRMSMQYLSSSTIRCRPRTWPSMRRSRLRYASFSPE
jgi:acyl-CoA synthetase (AMP-forming)/AMP-acid ligase II